MSPSGELALSYLLGLDVGSGRCKAALVEAGGRVRRLAVRPMPLRRAASGEATYDAYAVGPLQHSLEPQPTLAEAYERVLRDRYLPLVPLS